VVFGRVKNTESPFSFCLQKTKGYLIGFFLENFLYKAKTFFITTTSQEYKIMITRTWKNHPIIPQSKNLSYNPFQWVNDFEEEVLENNRKVFSRVYNTDIDEHWLKSDND